MSQIKIPLTQGLFSTIDSGDFDIVSKFKWFAQRSKKGVVYAVAISPGFKPKKRIQMHRLILGSLDTTTVLCDHIDHDGLNNTRKNLRLVSSSQNAMNRRSQLNTSSKFKGVHKQDRSWIAAIRKPNSRSEPPIYIGSFKTEEAAAIAYNEKAKELHGEFACLNSIYEDYARRIPTT